jgi:hypothetical protein
MNKQRKGCSFLLIGSCGVVTIRGKVCVHDLHTDLQASKTTKYGILNSACCETDYFLSPLFIILIHILYDGVVR